MKKKIILISLISLIGGFTFIWFSNALWAQTVKKAILQTKETRKEFKSIELFNRVKLMGDSTQMVRYNYHMEYEFGDTSKEELRGVVYKDRILNIDSNNVQMQFNDGSEYFSINHKVQMAVYSNLSTLKNEILKQQANKKDSLGIVWSKLNSMNLSDTLMQTFIEKDRSFENDQKLVIDVDFNDDSPMLSYYISFDKLKNLPDSMVVKMIEVQDIEPAEFSSELEDEVIFYNDLLARECLVTFKATNFQYGQFPVRTLLNGYITRGKEKVKLQGYKNYDLTVLK